MNVAPNRSAAFLLLTMLSLSACGGGAPQPAGNDAQRQEELIVKQAEAIRREAESNTSAIEQALENESAEIFENREALLNESAGNVTNSAEPRPAP